MSSSTRTRLLFVLHSIRVHGNPPTASGGRTLVRHPWAMDEEKLEPLAFSYSTE
jgi:hypothetical protein